MVDENINLLSRVLESAIEHKRKDLVFQTFRVLSFFSNFVGVQAHLLTLGNIKTLFSLLKEASALDRKFLLSILLDFV